AKDFKEDAFLFKSLANSVLLPCLDKTDIRRPLTSGNGELEISIGEGWNKDEEVARLKDKLSESALAIQRLEKLLGNDGFVAKAPANIVEKEKERLASIKLQKEKLENFISSLN
ncbi:hypothetical protein ACFL6Y_12010, partial [Elusimicrobiota bacterium]